jgi:hypothetical protein
MSVSAPEGFSKAYRTTFSDKEIDFCCGPRLVLDYADYQAIEGWRFTQQKMAQALSREKSAMEKRQLVLERKRSLRFADDFTMGDRFRLMGAFGIAFDQPFAPRSTQKFPYDEALQIVLPSLPREFENGTVLLEISPTRVPIIIRGQFKGLSFQRLAIALSTKCGTPLKSSRRHIIHRVNSDHLILKQLDEKDVELAFIDTAAKSDQRARLWEKESEGV